MLKVYKNDQIPSETHEDVTGGQVSWPYAGELRLGNDATYLGEQGANVDGTYTSMPEEDETISKMTVCDCCGFPVKSRKDLTMTLSGFYRCSDCVEDESYY